MRTEGGNSFYIGETIKLLIRLSAFNTRVPVTLDTIELIEWALSGGDPDNDVLPEAVFVEGEVGNYVGTIQTVDMGVGTYDFSVRMILDADVVIKRDRVVLREIIETPPAP